MEEITGPVIAITLVLSSVFIPTAFITGISGQFYRQFALTIAAATLISALNALTMAPARAVQLIKPRGVGHESEEREALPRLGVTLLCGFLAYWLLTPILAPLLGVPVPGPEGHETVAQGASTVAIWVLRGAVFVAGSIGGRFLSPLVNRVLGGIFKGFNWLFDRATNVYGRTVALFLRVSVIVLVIYGGLIGLTYLGFMRVPTGFIPEQDKGYLVVLIGLAAKNAILIVEFAKQRQDEGRSRFDAVIEACRLRLRPILMTSFAFILGVVPLITSTGAGAEMRFALGIAVFSGMLGVTVFGLFFTPVFYVAVRWFSERRGDKAPDKAAHQPPAEVSSAPPTERVASTGS